jgi:hypothetical protein
MDGPTTICPGEIFSLYIDLSQISQDVLRASLSKVYSLEPYRHLKPSNWVDWNDDGLFTSQSGEVRVENIKFLPVTKRRKMRLEFDVFGAETGFVVKVYRDITVL